MEKDLKNKTVVITGGANGIGYEIADHYLASGIKVAILLDLVEETGVQAADTLNDKYGKGKAVFYKCDVVKDLDTIYKKLIDTYKRIDVLINNAGILNEQAIQRTFDINVLGVINWTFKFWEHMRKDTGGNGGTIINIASIYGFRIIPQIPVYQASKFACLGFSKSFGDQSNYKIYGVRVIAICPGLTKTNMTFAPKPFDEQMAEEMNRFILEDHEWQESADLGRGAVEVFQKAESGSAWLIEGAHPAKEVV